MKYEYYLWIWINKEDLSKPFIYAADKKLSLVETTPATMYSVTQMNPVEESSIIQEIH